MADQVRGAVDGWDFKQYVLVTLFYRFVSEEFVLQAGKTADGRSYDQLQDEEISDQLRERIIERFGFIILPSQLFQHTVVNASKNRDLNTTLATIFKSIEQSAQTDPQARNSIEGLFADFDTSSKRLGNTVDERNRRLTSILQGVNDLKLGTMDETHIDIVGDAYEFLISKYASNAGKSGGEFFTPQNISRLVARLAMHNMERNQAMKIYDPACGSGSLLLQVRKLRGGKDTFGDTYYGQEINHTNYNLARMNMFLHGVNYTKFQIHHGDTLLSPAFREDKPFDVIVSNPPYSIKWVGNENPSLLEDERFRPAGVLAPKNKADFAFILHALHYLSDRGRAAFVSFPGIFYRGGAEQKIRKYLVDNNFVEAVIALGPNLFYGTSIAVNILVLSKHKPDSKIQFIDASREEFYKKETNNNVLTEEHIERIVGIFDRKEDEEYLATSVEREVIVENDYNMAVSAYVQAEDMHEQIDIAKLNAEVETSVKRIDALRRDIDKLIKQLEV